MNTIIKKSLQSLLVVPALALGVGVLTPALQPSIAYAQHSSSVSGSSTGSCSGDVSGGVQSGVDCAKGDGVSDKGLFESGGIFTTVVNVLLFIIGAIAVIMLIYGGIRYVISGGDASAVTAAKNTILYAIVGIIVALLAYAIVNFVVGKFAA